MEFAAITVLIAASIAFLAYVGAWMFPKKP